MAQGFSLHPVTKRAVHARGHSDTVNLARGQRHTQCVCMFCAILASPDGIGAQSPDVTTNKTLA